MKIKKAVLITTVVLAILTIGLGVAAVAHHESENKVKQEQTQEKLSQEKLSAQRAKKKAREDNKTEEEKKIAKEKMAAEEKKVADQKKAAEDKRVADEKKAAENKGDSAEKKKDIDNATGKTATPQPQNGTTGSHIVCIDPGHQAKGDGKMEPNGPGSSTMKARVTGGTRGTTTGIYEYQLNLTVAEKLKDELIRRGYKVYMTRESHNVDISNKERAQYATSVGAEITVRIHANGSDSSRANGAMTLVPSKSNRYVSRLASSSYTLGKCIIDSYCSATGFKNLGVQSNDTMTGINFCTSPVAILEMGFMSNPSDDTNMNNDQCQSKMVTGIANGIDTYFDN